jgi:tyrosine-protein phosphatase YwqE
MNLPMFNIFKKRKPALEFEYFPIRTDMHSHILPGLDDGSPDLETSVRLVRGLMDMGVKKSIASPHIIGDLYRNSPDTIFPALQSLQEELKKQEIDFELAAAAEYMMDAYFIDLMSDKNVLLTVTGRSILTEFSFSTMPQSPEKMTFALLTEGFTPILAHPERYPYYSDDMDNYHRMTELGFKLQINLLSLTGYYGKDVARSAHYIVKNDLCSFVGTDMHHEKHLEALQDPRNRAIFKETLGHREWNEALD